MLSITLGPLALPVAPLLLLLGAGAASWLATRLAGREQADDAGRAVFGATLAGLLAARAVHLLLQADLYAAAPLSAFDIRDGGWHAPSGAVAGALWLGWRGWRAPALRRALAGGALAGVLLWTAGTLLTRPLGGHTLPALMLAELDSGAVLALPQAARGRPLVVNLWASWCGPCRQEMPVLAAAQQREGTVGFLFVNQGESAATVRAYLAAEKLVLREVLLDRGSTLGPAVGSRGLPTTLFYDARGRLVDAHVGVLNAASLEGRLRRLGSAPSAGVDGP
jgi:thiol-disulfide isomerase/thioredoxin